MSRDLPDALVGVPPMMRCPFCNSLPLSKEEELHSVDHSAGRSAKDCVKHVVIYCTVARWVTAFRVGRDVVNDNPRTGRPHVENNTVQLLASLLDVDCRWTARELAAEVGMSQNCAPHSA
ncbi:hypothetical protein C0J52_10655 [Blattella germanica]|nr:hypothetical protein C0J52_10655 [Blattella germanica]